jgi:hypothetical protein
MKEQHYYAHLPKEERAAYEAMYAGFLRMDKVIRIPRLPGEALSRIFFQVRLDNPMIFYVTSFSYRYGLEATHAELLPVYLFEKSRILEHKKAIEARVNRLIRPMQGKSEEERERFIHDFICDHVRYDKLEKPYSHEVIGPLTNGVGVCEGIAKTVKLLCDGLGLDCIVVICDADRANGVKYRHAWNEVKLGGGWYHLDVTFDLSLCACGIKRYDYYNLSDQAVFRDHRPLIYPAPPCNDGSRFYYRQEKRSWTKPEDVTNRAGQALRKKQPNLVFHWRGGYLSRSVVQELAARLQQAAVAKGKGVAISLNAPQGVFFVSFLEEAQTDALRLEQPDEGEGALAPQTLRDEEETAMTPASAASVDGGEQP